MIQIKRIPRAKKDSDFDIDVTRTRTRESMRLFCETKEKREAVEKQVLKLFKIEHDNVSIIDEEGTIVKYVSPK